MRKSTLKKLSITPLKSHDSVLKTGALKESLEIGQKMPHEHLGFVLVSATNMRRDVAILGREKWITCHRRLGVQHIEPRPRYLSMIKSIHQRIFVY